MNNEILEITNNIPEHQTRQSDPAWKFYLTWHCCEYSKGLIDQALSIMNQDEFPNAELYEKARELILDASGFLQEQGHRM